MESLESIKKLKENIFRNFLIFLPNNFFDNTENLPNGEKELINKIIHLDDDFLNNLPDTLNDYNLKEQLILESVLNKTVTFKKNIVELIKEKEKFDKPEFNFLINEYYEFISAGTEWCNIQVQLIQNVQHDKNLTESIKKSFRIQYQAFHKHVIDLEYNFKIKKNKSTINNYNLSEFITDLHSISKNNTVSQNSKTDDNIDLIKLSQLLNHEKNEEIEKIIFDNFKDKKGKTLRCIIEYLATRDVVIIGSGDQQKIFNAFVNLFDHNIGKYQSMFGYTIYRATDKTYKSIRTKFIDLLKKEDIKL